MCQLQKISTSTEAIFVFLHHFHYVYLKKGKKIYICLRVTQHPVCAVGKQMYYTSSH